MVGPVELCRAIAATGPAVAFATPAYPPFFAELEAAGFRVFTAGRDSDGKIDVEALDDVQHEHAQPPQGDRRRGRLHRG